LVRSPASRATASSAEAAATGPQQLRQSRNRPEGGPGGLTEVPSEFTLKGRAAFGSQLAQLKQENKLLQSGNYTRAQARAILKAELQLGYQLTENERKRLLPPLAIGRRSNACGRGRRRSRHEDRER
jgi:hypothetical protein